ncbi:MAG: hypothetical protein FI729_01390 [SAR202 cluster bacterium]|nr:hypothetical protein [SAR202 cluster bacterium]|tara:strand:- start:569 stop:991 length:423 start_codon:yes stop_codon:yes gene_type:complete
MARNLRDHVVVISSLQCHNDGSVSGSGPSYTVTYDTGEDVSDAQIGHYVYIEKREAGAGASSTVLSTYVYVITGKNTGGGEEMELGGQHELTLKYVYDTAETGDDSPADLPNGSGSSGSPDRADHKVVMILGPGFEMFME